MNDIPPDNPFVYAQGTADKCWYYKKTWPLPPDMQGWTGPFPTREAAASHANTAERA